MRLFVVALVLVLIPSTAVGQFAEPDQLERVASVYVGTPFSFRDSEDQRCEPATSTLKAEAELVFRRSGILVSDQTYSVADILRTGIARGIQGDQAQEDFAAEAYAKMPHQFDVQMTGVYLVGRCAISYDFELWRREVFPHPEKLMQHALVTSFSMGGVWTGPPSSATSTMKEQTQNAATLLANEILKARQQ